MNGTCTCAFFLVPAPWGPGEGPKGQISLNLNYKVYFKVDFHSAAWVMPRGGSLEYGRGGGGQKLFLGNSTRFGV